MRWISLAAAVTLTERSERTLWRWIADGTIMRAPDNVAGKTLIDLDSIKPYISIPLEPEDLDIVISADACGGGNVEAQNELALLFLANGKPKSAIYWLELAAGQGFADAMYWLGRCHIDGNGLPKNVDMGIMWLSKAAAHGHVISRCQMDALCTPHGTLRGAF